MRSAVLGAAVLALVAGAARADIWVFGDSTVDTGWYEISPFSGNSEFDSDLQDAARYDIGKPTNNPGPMSVEVLASAFFAAARPANQGGTNFATSGAKNTNVNTPQNGGFPNAIPTVTQIANYLARHAPGPHDLFVVSSGGNDVSYALTDLSGSAQTAYIQQQAANLAASILQLQMTGARHIIVANLPASFGTPAEMVARALYNSSLQSALENAAVEYAWGDVNVVRQRIAADPASFGIRYLTNAAGEIACPQPSAALNIDSAWALLCSRKSPVTQPTTFADAALFADDEHWASHAQTILGSYYVCLAARRWPHQLVTSRPIIPREEPLPPPIPCHLLFPRPDQLP
jgi:outer membrane lipase/esterase